MAVEELVQAVALHLFTPEEAEPSSPSPLPGPVDDTGERVDAVRDRIVLLRSDSCSYRQEPWFGNDEEGLDLASCAIVHFVKENN